MFDDEFLITAVTIGSQTGLDMAGHFAAAALQYFRQDLEGLMEELLTKAALMKGIEYLLR